MISTNIENIAKGLVDARTTLASHLTVKGVTASKDERLNDLIAKVLDITTGVTPSYQEKTFETNGTFLPDEGFDAFSKVTISVQGGGGVDGTRWVLNEDAYLVDEDGNKWCKEELYYNSTNTGIARQSNVPYSKETPYENYAYYNTYDCIGKTTLYTGTYNLGNVYVNGENLGSINAYTPKEYGLYEVGFQKPDNNYNRVSFSGNTRIVSAVVNSNDTNGNLSMYSGCTNLEKAHIISAQYNTIANRLPSNMFKDCTKLSEVVIDNGLKQIDSSAFEGCSELKTINIPETVYIIRSNCFQNCTSLTSINIPSGVTLIESSAFSNCTSLSGSFTFPTGVTEVTNYVLRSTNVSRVVINNAESIGSNAFYGCSKLVRIDCYSLVAPTLGSNCFKGIPDSGIINVPQGSDYSTWQEVLPNWEFRAIL